jgi:hypothetical protein
MTYKNNSDGTNTVGAIDGFFRMGESHSLNTMLIYSNTSRRIQQLMMQTKAAFAGYAQYYYTNNQWKIWWTQSVVTKDFNPELGFVLPQRCRSVLHREYSGTTVVNCYHSKNGSVHLSRVSSRILSPGINR